MPLWEPHRTDPACYPEPGLDLPVVYGDLDLNGHLNNVVLGRFFEHSRTETFAAIGFSQAVRQRGGRSFVVRVSTDYLREVRLNQVLQVRSRIVAVGSASACVEQATWVDGTCVALTKVIVAHAREGVSAPWPEEVVELLGRVIAEGEALRS
jgi:acyl-CoA thioester hydrolase